ncbi:MAG: hypothetical protein ACLSVD_16735 [Eggerthellaceae bacterium]
MNSTEEPAGPLLRSQFEQFRQCVEPSQPCRPFPVQQLAFAMSWSGVLSTSLGVFAAGSGMNGFG